MLYYPVTKEERSHLLESGLKPTDRKMVHLSLGSEAAKEAGKVRCAELVIITVDPKKAVKKGVVIQKAGKTVFLAKVATSGAVLERAVPIPIRSITFDYEKLGIKQKSAKILYLTNAIRR